MKQLWELYIIFARIGVCTFGGGLTMLPLLEAELINNKNWVTEDELMDYYAIGQCTPGIIAVNVATFVGHKRKGIIGGIAATLGMVTPSLIIIIIIAAFISSFAGDPIVQSAFSAVRVTVAVLILNTVIKMWKSSIKNKMGIVLAVLAMGLSFLLGISPIAIILIGGALGLLLPRSKKEVDKK